MLPRVSAESEYIASYSAAESASSTDRMRSGRSYTSQPINSMGTTVIAVAIHT